MRRRPADLEVLIKAIGDARTALNKSRRPHFRRTRHGWKVDVTLRLKKYFVTVRVRDPKMLRDLKEWLTDQEISFEHAKRFGGKKSPDRLELS